MSEEYLATYRFLFPGSKVFHLIKDGEYGGRHFDVITIKRVEEIMVVWDEHNDIAKRDIELKDFKSAFFPTTNPFLDRVNAVNFKMGVIDKKIYEILGIVDEMEKMVKRKRRKENQ